jgi:hypothetical protein
MCASFIPVVFPRRVLGEPRRGRVEGPRSIPPRGIRVIALRPDVHKTLSLSPLFSYSCKRVRNSLKTRNFKSLSFHTHAHSFAVSPVFATHTQNNPGVYTPVTSPKSKVSLDVFQLSLVPSNTYDPKTAVSSRHSPGRRAGRRARARDGSLSAAADCARLAIGFGWIARRSCRSCWRSPRRGCLSLEFPDSVLGRIRLQGRCLDAAG